VRSIALEAWAAPWGGPDPWIALRAPPTARRPYVWAFIFIFIYELRRRSRCDPQRLNFCHEGVYLPPFGQHPKGMQSEGECENVGMDTPHAVDVYIVFAVTTGIRALEPWLATRAPGRATGSAYNHTVTMVTCVAIGSRKISADTFVLAW
jgi:hypothetical protein